MFMSAEGEGFKPPIPERGIPDFESSAIDHSANLPIKRESSSIAAAKVITFFEIAKYSHSFFFLFGYVKENVYLCTPIYNVRKLLLNKERK